MPRGPIAIVKSDLSTARLVTGGTVREWTAPTLPDDRPPTVREARARAAAAAAWLARDPDAKRRIEAIYTDVDEALCVWMRSPSAARPVVASQLRTMAQDWGTDASVLAVEPLRDDVGTAPRRRARLRMRGEEESESTEASAPPDARDIAPGFAVLAIPDAMTRMLAGAVDIAGARVGMVATLWHLMAESGGSIDPSAVRGVVMVDPAGERVVWVWADRTGLLAAGAARHSSTPVDDVVRRVALDWLTWGAQLGRCPTELVVVGEDAGAWAEAFGASWQPVPTRVVSSSDPIAAIVDLAPEEPIVAPHSGRRALTRITHRPTRATRTRYQIAGAALVLMLVATSSVVFRLSQKSREWRGTAAAVRQEMIKAVRDAWPKQATTQPMTSPRRVAETLLEQEVRETKPFEAPPRPRPILQEALRIATVLATRNPDATSEPQDPVIKLTQLVLDQDRINTLQFAAPDRQIATEVEVALNTDSAWMRWERMPQSPNPNSPNLQGTWTKEAE